VIDSRAVVASSARVDDSAQVGAYTIIGEDVEIGRGTRVEPHVVIKGPTVIGADNHIFQFASIGDEPQDKKYKGQRTRLVIGNRNTIREACTINRGTVEDRSETTIGDDNWIMAYTHIAHDCVIGNNIVLANSTQLAGHVHIGNYAWLGGFTGVHQFCHIGAHAMLGIASVVTKDVPAFVTAQGQPAEPRGINAEGLKRRGFTQEQIRNIREAYRTVFRKALNLDEAVAIIEELVLDQPELQLFLDSLKQGSRGLAR
jgi:UDP-N-acetylglucosamine acyltransferase